MKKRSVVLVLMVVMLVSLFTGCGKKEESSENASQAVESKGDVETTSASGETEETSSPNETYTIAVAWSSISDVTPVRMKYLEEEVGPALGVDFIFSEELTDAGAVITFLENAYAAGADGVMSTFTDASEQIAAKCDELGLYLVLQSSRYVDEIADIEHYMGICGVDIAKVGQAYGILMNEKLDPNNKQNILLISGGAPMGVTSHVEATSTMLKQIQELYGLTFTKDISELTTVSAITDVETGSDVKLTIVPGFPNADTYVSGISSLLQTGDYDVLLSVYPSTSVLATAIDEVEIALNKNIVVLSNVNFGEGTKAAFETLDSTGNPTLDGAVLATATAQDAYGVVMIYNGITGYSDVIKPDGKAAALGAGVLVCSSPEEFAQLSLIDTSAETYCYSGEELKQMCKAYNPDVTYEDIQKIVNEFSSADLITRKLMQ